VKVTKTWNGLTFLERLNRASGRAIVGIGMQVAVETKRVTHVDTGSLRRSVHAAPPSADHGGDEGASGAADMMMMSQGVKAENSVMGPIIEVGSWLDYACVEWVGRSHPGVTQGLEAVRGARADAIVAQAFIEEGLAGGKGKL
jgi:hypothetical protein